MIETAGTLIGRSNVVTRSNYRPAPGLDLDANPALLDRVRANSVRALEGRESFIHDAILLGRRVRLLSNSHHLADFWRDNFPTEAEWKSRTAEPVSPKPFLTVHAMIRVEAESEAAYFSKARREVYLFNSSYYGGLRACAMEAFGRLLEGLHVFHGAAVEVNGRVLAIVYPREVIHPTPTWGLMELPGARFLADGWLVAEPDGRIRAIEKSVYLRTCFLENYPEYAPRILSAKFENIPPSDPAQTDPLARLVASKDSRAMVDAAALFGRSPFPASPPAAAAFQLSAGTGEPIRVAPVDPFPCPGYEVRVGSVAGHPREVARLIART